MTTNCPKCGEPMENNICKACGYKEEVVQNSAAVPVQEAQPIAPPIVNQQTKFTPGVSKKDRTIALILCILAGGLGAHRFYVGKIGTGILYLFTAGLFGIGWIIDIIWIAKGSFKDKFDLPLRD